MYVVEQSVHVGGGPTAKEWKPVAHVLAEQALTDAFVIGAVSTTISAVVQKVSHRWAGVARSLCAICAMGQHPSEGITSGHEKGRSGGMA